MPIRKELQHHYQGDEWRMLREAVLHRAKQRCECVGECGMGHPIYPCYYGCLRENGSVLKGVTVVLTIAHLCHEASCKKPSHVKALCQRCHCRLDRFQHAHNRMKRKTE